MNFFRKWRYGFWAISQLIVAAPKEFFQIFILVLIQGLTPGISLILIEKMINWVETMNSINIVLLPFGLLTLWGIILFFETAATPFVSVARIHLNEKILTHCNILLMQKANSLDSLTSFENSKLYDQIQFLKEESKRKPLNFVYIFIGFFKDIVALIGIIFALSTLNTILPFLVILAAIPRAISTLLLEKQSWDQMLFRSPETRKMAWLSSLTLDEKVAKEIRLFNFGSHLVQRYRELAKSFHITLGQNNSKQMLRSTCLSFLTVTANLSIFIWIILQSKEAIFGIGAVVMGIQAFVITQIQISGFLQNIAMLMPVLCFFEKLKLFLNNGHAPNITTQGKSISSIQNGITFENVSFQYPDGRIALKDVNLHIPVGKKLALVGENGAGKTTFIKLLARFYDPIKGRILVDGTDLKDIDVHSWRLLLSAVFQDFGQYHFSIRENIALSNLEYLNDIEALQKALAKGGFDHAANKFPQGLDTLLGREFSGTSLSGGEWQKLAMSRAFMRDAQVLILDEPTAALDPKSEYDVFRHFSSNIEGKTAIFITHRLGSVTMADHIIVLKNGSIAEHGSHEELLQQNGPYSKMFAMQASLYQKSSNSINSLQR